MRVALPLSLSLALAALVVPQVASARPLSLIPDDRPWTRGTLMPSFGLGGSFGSRGGGSLLVGAGLNYFVVNNLSVGLHLRNFTTFLPPGLKSEFPGIEKQIPTNEFSLIPGMTAVLYRSYRASPYVFAGVGPVFLNHKRGVIAEWNAGPGVLIGLGQRMAIDLGLNFSMRFPGDRCETAYTYAGTEGSVVFNACGFRWGIRAGLVFGFGVGRARHPAPPPQDPYNPPQGTSPGYPEPAPEPLPVAPTPAEPEAPPAPAPVPDSPMPAPPGAPAPAPEPTPAPTSPPAGESVPVGPPPG